MAQINYSKLSDKKLNALLENATAEERALIEQELASRQAARATKEYVDEEPLSPEQEKQLAEAEANEGKAVKAPKMTDEERAALAEECKKNIGHKCQVVPFNSIEWVDGYISAVQEEKRTNKVMYRIKTENGKDVFKVHDSHLLKISEELAEVETKKAKRAARAEWSDEQFNEAIEAAGTNVGKMTCEGRIVAIVPDKRSKAILYRIEVPAPTEEDANATKSIHRVSTADLQIAESFDEVGQEMQDKFAQRRANRNSKDNSPEAKLARAEEALKLAQERLAKAQENLKKAEENLAALKAEVEVPVNSDPLA